MNFGVYISLKMAALFCILLFGAIFIGSLETGPEGLVTVSMLSLILSFGVFITINLVQYEIIN